jgi:hypothetical protein
MALTHLFQGTRRRDRLFLVRNGLNTFLRILYAQAPVCRLTFYLPFCLTELVEINDYQT